MIPSSDPHLSEYLPERWMGREWISGFTGSMGSVIVTPEHALLFADSRYWLQAETEIAGSGFTLFRIRSGASQEHIEWLAQHVGRGHTVAIDGAVMGLAAVRALEPRLGAGLRAEFPLFALTVAFVAGRPFAVDLLRAGGLRVFFTLVAISPTFDKGRAMPAAAP